MLGRFADARRMPDCAGLIDEAATTFEKPKGCPAQHEQWKQNRLVSLIRGNDRGHGLATASLALRMRLLEAPEAVTEPV